MTPEDRLRELDEELLNGRIVEARLIAEAEHVDGLYEHGSRTIYIDPRTAIVSTLLHELIHRRYPSWSETRVAREERRLISQMTSADVSRWYRKYLKTRSTRQKTKNCDED